MRNDIVFFKMKKIVFVLSMVNALCSYAQVLSVDSVFVYNYQNIITDSVIIKLPENKGGPSVVFYCSIKNNTDSTLEINFESYSLNLSMNIKNYRVKEQVFSFSIPERNSYQLETGKVVLFDFYVDIFLGTPIHNYEKSSYLKDLSEVLPAVCIFFEESNGIDISTCRVEKVKLK